MTKLASCFFTTKTSSFKLDPAIIHKISPVIWPFSLGVQVLEFCFFHSTLWMKKEFVQWVSNMVIVEYFLFLETSCAFCHEWKYGKLFL